MLLSSSSCATRSAEETFPTFSSWVSASPSLCASSPSSRLQPCSRGISVPSLLFGGAGCGACHPLCALCLCASSHPEELQSGTRALCLTAGMFCIYWHMGSDWLILTWKQFWQNKGLMQEGRKNPGKQSVFSICYCSHQFNKYLLYFL